MKILKTLCTLNVWIVWHMNYIPIKLFLKILFCSENVACLSNYCIKMETLNLLLLNLQIHQQIMFDMPDYSLQQVWGGIYTKWHFKNKYSSSAKNGKTPKYSGVHFLMQLLILTDNLIYFTTYTTFPFSIGKQWQFLHNPYTG